MCGCQACDDGFFPPGPETAELFYEPSGTEFIFDGQEWIETGRTNWVDVVELPVTVSSFNISHIPSVDSAAMRKSVPRKTPSTTQIVAKHSRPRRSLMQNTLDHADR